MGWGEAARSVRVRAAGAMAALSGLAALRAGRGVWRLPARLSAGLPGCWLRRGYVVGRAEVRGRAGSAQRAGLAGGRAVRVTEHPGLGDALPETVEPLNPSSFPERLPPAGKVRVRGERPMPTPDQPRVGAQLLPPRQKSFLAVNLFLLFEEPADSYFGKGNCFECDQYTLSSSVVQPSRQKEPLILLLLLLPTCEMHMWAYMSEVREQLWCSCLPECVLRLELWS